MGIKSTYKKMKHNKFVKMGLLGGGLTAGTILSGGTLPVALGVGLAGAGLYQQYQNYQAEQKNTERQWKAYNENLAREDDSIQRRVTDLKAAGLSPVLAAGQGAGAGAVFGGRPPQMDNPIDNVTQVMGLLKMKEDISNTVTQRDLINQQVKQSKAMTKQANANAGYITKNAGLKDIELDNAELTGTAGTSLPGRMFNDATGAAVKSLDTMKNSISNTVRELTEKAERFNKPSYSDDYNNIKRTNNKRRK